MRMSGGASGVSCAASMWKPKTAYLIEKKDKKTYRQSIVNKDFDGRSLIIDPWSVNTAITPNVGKAYYSIEELTEADKKRKLKGALKETFDQMKEEDEYLFMIYELKWISRKQKMIFIIYYECVLCLDISLTTAS